MINEFFVHLAGRLRKENHLSDVSWAIFESSKLVKQQFIRLFFPTITPAEAENIRLHREVSHSEGRSDFLFTHEGKQFVIEIKINDRNYHENYDNAFSGRIGFLSNYFYANEKFVSKTWYSFAVDIEEALKQQTGVDLGEKQLVEGYVNYILIVNKLTRTTKMNLTDLKSLFVFNSLVSRVVNTKFVGITSSESSQSKGFYRNRSGVCFRLDHVNGRWAEGWYGVWFEETVNFYVAIWRDNWGNNEMIHAAFKNNDVGNGIYYNVDEYEDEDKFIWIPLKNEFRYELLDPNSTSVRQEQILTGFYSDVINNIQRFFEI